MLNKKAANKPTSEIVIINKMIVAITVETPFCIILTLYKIVKIPYIKIFRVEKMYRIVFDTNFLIDLFRFKKDPKEIDELVGNKTEFFVTTSTINELEKISSRKSPVSRFAKIALGIVHSKFETIETKGISFDEEVFDVLDANTIVATNDSLLRKRLKTLGVKTIYLRARKKLAMS